MKTRFRAFTFLRLFACGAWLCVAGCGYDNGYQDGFNAGKSAGRREGEETGRSQGRAAGYDEGRRAGLAVGYARGTLAFTRAYWLPSLGFAALIVSGLIVTGVSLRWSQIVLLPPVRRGLDRMEAERADRRSRRDERRERRRHLARCRAEQDFRVGLLTAQVMEKAQAAIHDEETLSRFEQALHTMRATVSEEQWTRLRKMGAEWAKVAAVVENHPHLDPRDKQDFRREMIAAYHSSHTAQQTYE